MSKIIIQIRKWSKSSLKQKSQISLSRKYNIIDKLKNSNLNSIIIMVKAYINCSDSLTIILIVKYPFKKLKSLCPKLQLSFHWKSSKLCKEELVMIPISILIILNWFKCFYLEKITISLFLLLNLIKIKFIKCWRKNAIDSNWKLILLIKCWIPKVTSWTIIKWKTFKVHSEIFSILSFKERILIDTLKIIWRAMLNTINLIFNLVSFLNSTWILIMCMAFSMPTTFLMIITSIFIRLKRENSSLISMLIDMLQTITFIELLYITINIYFLNVYFLFI